MDSDFAGLKSSVGLLTKAVFGFYALIGAVIGGGFILRGDLGDIKAQMARGEAEIIGLRRDMTAVQDRIGALQKNASDVANIEKDIAASQKQMQGQIASGFAQIENKLSAALVQPLILNPEEEQIVRDFFGLPKGPAANPPKYAIRDVVQNATPVPENLAAKLPKLKGFAYAKDPNGSVLIVDNTGHVVSVVGPA